MQILTMIAPFAGVGALLGLSYAGKGAASFFSARATANKNDQADAALARLTSGLSRLAGEIAMDVMPVVNAGGDFKTVLAAGVADGVTKAKQRFPNDVQLLGAGEDLLGSMLHGEVGKIVAPLIAAATNVSAPTATSGASSSGSGAIAAHAITVLGQVAAGALAAATAGASPATPTPAATADAPATTEPAVIVTLADPPAATAAATPGTTAA